MTFTAAVLILAWMAIVALAFAMAGLLRQVHVLTVALGGERVGIGVPPPIFAPLLDGLTGKDGWNAPAVLLFAEASCPKCEEVLTQLSRIAQSDEGALQFAALFPDANAGGDNHDLFVLPNQASVFRELGVAATPFGVAIDKEGVIVARAPVGSREALEQFVDTARRVVTGNGP